MNDKAREAKVAEQLPAASIGECEAVDKEGRRICRREIWSPKERKCVFHAEEKTAEEFRISFEVELEKVNSDDNIMAFDAEGFVFPDGVMLEDEDFDKPVHLAESRCGESVSFRGCKFQSAVFDGSQFKQGISFRDVKFIHKVSFESCRFSDKASLSGATFPGGTSFKGSTFGDKAWFGDCTFGNEAIFTNTVFGDNVSFGNVKFENKANFEDAVFKEGASFFGAKFGSGASFRSTKFGSSANFHSAKFGVYLFFHGAKFGDKASFMEAEFGAMAFFHSATFGDGAAFTSATFGEGLLVSATSFGSGTYFSSGVFNGDASFYKVVFGPKASFVDATFKGNVVFDDISFGPGSRFRYSIFHKDVVLSKLTNKEKLDLSKIRIERPERIVVRGMDLLEVSFAGTNIEKAEIVDCKWGRHGGRAVVFDELLLDLPTEDSSKPSVGEVEQLYRRLQKNYEDSKRYADAGEFYIGAMEMRRRQLGESGGRLWRWMRQNLLSMVALYRHVSLYGERYMRTLGWMLAAFLLFPALYLLSGFGYPETNLPDSVYANIEYDLSWQPSPIGHVLSDYGKALVVSLHALTFQRYWPFKLMMESQVLFIAQTVIGAILLALFLLAVRRRFRR